MEEWKDGKMEDWKEWKDGRIEKWKNETSLKTIYFGLKPSKWLIINYPSLKDGVIDIRVNQGFSHIS